MAEKTDRRKIRTKQLLRKALLELIEEKGMDSVTVSDVAERAGMNRGTFYLHYRDVADLLDHLKGEIFEGLTNELGDLNPIDLRSYAEKGQPYPVLVNILEYLLTQADFFRVMFGPRGDLAFPMQIKEFMKTRMFHHIFERLPMESASRIPRDYIIAYMSSANIGVLMHWFETGNRLTPSEVGLIVTRIVSEGPLAVTGIRN